MVSRSSQYHSQLWALNVRSFEWCALSLSSNESLSYPFDYFTNATRTSSQNTQSPAFNFGTL